MIIPTNFKNDIQTRDTNLIPIVLLGTYPPGEDVLDEYVQNGDLIPISTNAGNVLSDKSWVFLPILLKIPSLKESIDLEKRNYKISSLTLSLSNFEYSGERFSDRIGRKNLINQECRIFWVSPSTTNVSFFDLEEVIYNESDHYNRALQTYYGVIRKYTHNDETVTLLIEDRSQEVFHKNIPLEDDRSNFVTSEIAHSKDRYKPNPIVYGNVKRSPCVFDGQNIILDKMERTIRVAKEVIDGDLMNFEEELPGLFVRSGDDYF